MLQLIRKLISRLSMPEEVYVDSLGDYWEKSDFIPFILYSWEDCECPCLGYHYKDKTFPHCYRNLVQNYWGYWKLGNERLGKFTPLEKLNKSI